MKNKKWVLLSFIVFPALISCTNNITSTNNPKITPSSTKQTTLPTVSEMPITDYKNISGILKSFITNESNNTDLEGILSEDSLSFQDTSMIVDKNNHIHFINKRTNRPIDYDINNKKLTFNQTCSIYKVSSTDNLCWSTIKLKKGLDNNTYLIRSGEVIRVSDNNNIKSYSSFSKKFFGEINDIAVAKDSSIYLLSSYQGIAKLDYSGNIIWSKKLGDFTGEIATYPTSIDIDKEDNLYLFDVNSLKIKKIDKNGNTVNIIGGGYDTNISKDPLKYRFTDQRVNITLDNEDNLYFIEESKNKIIKYSHDSKEISEFYPDNNFKTINTIAFDAENNAYIFDPSKKSIFKVDKNNNLTTALRPDNSQGDGNDINNVYLENASGIYSYNNDLYISETDRIRKVDRNKKIETIAGGLTYPAVSQSAIPVSDVISNQATQTTLYFPKVLYYKEPDLYVSANNNLLKLKNNRFSYVSQDKSSEGYKNDKLPLEKANLLNIDSMTGDKNGNLYFDLSQIIRKSDVNGNTEIFAGKVNYNPYGEFPSHLPPPIPESNTADNVKATDLSDLSLSSVVSDSKNNIYAITTYQDSTFQNKAIRKISPDGIITRIAGNKDRLDNYDKNTLMSATDPLSIPINPVKMIIDKFDNIYFIDQFHDRIQENNKISYLVRKIDKNNKMGVYAGNLLNQNTNDINNKKATDIFFDIYSPIKDLTIDDNGFLYLLVGDNKIYRIE